MSKYRRLCSGTTLAVSMSLTIMTAASILGQSAIVRLSNPIPFHTGVIIGYEKSVVVKGNTRESGPTQANHIFVTIKVEIRSPFQYMRGMFREVTLVDDLKRIYQHRGTLTDQGWVQFDDASEPGVILTMEAKSYPNYLDIHFEVPSTTNALALKVGTVTQDLFGPVGK